MQQGLVPAHLQTRQGCAGPPSVFASRPQVLFVRKARIASDQGSHPRQTKLMNVHAPKLLTPEEFASLIDVAMSPPEVTVPPILQRLVTLGYVSLTARRPLVNGDGLIRLPESE